MTTPPNSEQALSEQALSEQALSEQALSCHDVTIRHGSVVALDGVSIQVGRGERVALIGSSGAGKSSLIHAAAGLVPPTSGEVRVLGEDLDRLKGAALRNHRRRIGLVSQQLGLAPALRVVHSVNGGRLGAWSTSRALGSLIRPSGTADVRRVLDLVKLGDRIHARTGDLSGGEQQRVAVARVLLQSPELVLADEPTSSVDPALADEVMALLCPPDPPWAVVVSVHNPDLAMRHVDRVIALSNGHVVFDRAADAIDDGEIDALYQIA